MTMGMFRPLKNQQGAEWRVEKLTGLIEHDTASSLETGTADPYRRRLGRAGVGVAGGVEPDQVV